MAGILFLAGSDDFARDVFARERRGYWSKALPLALEKRGFLGIEVDRPQRLADAQLWDSYDVVLVARLGDGAWPADAAARALAGRAQVLVEGPIPPTVAAGLGVRSEGPAPQSGTVVVKDEAVRAAAKAYGADPGGRVAPPGSRRIDREAKLDWTAQPGVPIGTTQAEAWRRPGWDVDSWSVVGETDTLAYWRDTSVEPARRWPAIVRRGALTACCFGLFAYLGQCHTSAPFEGPEFRSWPSTASLEALLLGLIDDMHARAGASRARVLEWPAGMGWVLNVRHDFDRPLTRAQLAAVLDAHTRVGTSATWYWRAKHLRRAGRRSFAAVVRNRGRRSGANSPTESAKLARSVAVRDSHEVALHTDLVWAGSNGERRVLESAIGRTVYGTSAHGDPRCFRFQGAPNVLWANEQGFTYTELIEHSHRHPHRFAALGKDGRIDVLDIVCLPHHESFDRSTKPGNAAMERMPAVAPKYATAGGMMQVLNHPDLNQAELFEMLAGLPVEGRINWTAGEAVQWWRRSHFGSELEIEPLRDGGFRVRSEGGVPGAELEVRTPDGMRRRYALYLEAGEVVTLRDSGLTARVGTSPAGRAGPERVADRSREWADVEPLFADAVVTYHRGAGHDVSSPAVTSAVRTNSALVPGRGDRLVDLLGALTGVDRLAGRSVLEVGCGFGSLAAYLSMRHRPKRLVALDNRAEWLEVARETAAKGGLRDVEWMVGDMRRLSDVLAEPVDVIIANNAFIYLPTRDAMLEALHSFRDALAPGGVVLLYHANRWRLRDPFTGSPLVHLLPPAAAGILARGTGWKHTHGRVRLVSPPGLARYLRASGFREVRVGGATPHRRPRRLRGYLGRYYAVGAHRPSGG